MTHYTCDRCGADIKHPGRPELREVVIDWPGNELRGEKETLVLTFSVTKPYVDFETPDLCVECYTHVLDLVSAQLDRETEQARAKAETVGQP